MTTKFLSNLDLVGFFTTGELDVLESGSWVKKPGHVPRSGDDLMYNLSVKLSEYIGKAMSMSIIQVMKEWQEKNNINSDSETIKMMRYIFSPLDPTE
jgi:hypothetical protein